MRHALTCGIVLALLLPAHVAAQAPPETLVVGLEQLFELARDGNESLRAMSRRLAADTARVRAARAALLPQLDADADLALLDIVAQTKKPFIGDGPLDVLITVGVSQKVWDGGRTRAETNWLWAAHAVEHANRTVAEQSIRLRLAESYYRLCGLRRELDVIDENLAMLDQRIRYAGLLVDAGRMSEVERGRFEVARAQLAGRRLQTKQACLSACLTISTILGRQAACYVPSERLAAPDPAGQDPAGDGIAGTAPTVRKNDALTERAEAEIRRARTARMPSLTAKAWYGWEFADAGFSLRDNDRWFAGAHMTVPLFDGLSARNKVAAARHGLEAAEIEREQALREVESAAGELLQRLAVLRERVGIEQDAARQAERNLRLGLVEYEAGRRPNMDIIDMQDSVLRAGLAVSALLVDYYATRARLMALAGML